MPDSDNQTEQFNIYFSNLNEEAQIRLCEAWNTTPEEENWDIDLAPLAVLLRES